MLRNITLSDLVKELAESFVVSPGTEQTGLHSTPFQRSLSCNSNVSGS